MQDIYSIVNQISMKIAPTNEQCLADPPFYGRGMIFNQIVPIKTKKFTSELTVLLDIINFLNLHFMIPW